MKNILFVLFLSLAVGGCNPLNNERPPEEPPQPLAQEPSPSETPAPASEPEPSAPAPQLKVAYPRQTPEEVWTVMMRSAISGARSRIDKSLALSSYEANRLLPSVELDCDPNDDSSWEEVSDLSARQEVLALADRFHREHRVVVGFSEDHEPDYEDAVVEGYNSLDFGQFTEDICELSIRIQCAPSFGEEKENGRLIEISWHPWGSKKACLENDDSEDQSYEEGLLGEWCCDDTDAYLDGHMVQNYRYYLWASEDFEQGFGAAFDWSFGVAISHQPMKFTGYRRGDDGQILVEGEFLWGRNEIPTHLDDMNQDNFQGVFESGQLKVIFRKSDLSRGFPRQYREEIPFRGGP